MNYSRAAGWTVTMSTVLLVLTAFSTLTTHIEPAHAEEIEWGTLRGKLVFDGEAPPPKVIVPKKDVNAFSKLTEESLLVDSKGGLANGVIFLLPPRGATVRTHPSYEATAKAKVELSTENGRIEPHVLLLRTSQSLLRVNKDEVAHCAHVQTIRNPTSGILFPPGSEIALKYPEAERMPVPIRCNIHPWMSGFVLIRDNPYMAKSQTTGEFEIKNIPAGTHVFRLWHEEAGYLRNVSFDKLQTDDRGRLTIDIKAGDNQLGTAKIPNALFGKTE